MRNFWTGKKVLVTGGTGFIGSFVAELLLQKGAKVTATTKSGRLKNVSHLIKDLRIKKTDLTDPKETHKITKNQDIVLNLASKVAGIQFNINHPATMFSDNIKIAQNIASASVKNNIERLLMVSSACVYPRNCIIPTPETEGFLLDPEPTNLGYGWAKRVEELIARFHYQEFGLKVAIARPYNAYGPRDNFDPEISHVIPGLIKRVFDDENPLVVWGSGKQTRSFLYAEDLARGLLEIAEKYPEADPINIGTDEEVTIAHLAKIIVNLSRKNTKIVFDKTKPDGQPKRNCNTEKAKEKIGFKAKKNLEEGLKNTIDWYKKNDPKKS